MSADQKTYAEFKVQYDAIADAWPVGAMDVILKNNPEMYTRMGRLTDALDAFMAKEKNAALDKTERKKFSELLAAWKRIHELGILFAKRHLKQ